jgi:hypothetical protein
MARRLWFCVHPQPPSSKEETDDTWSLSRVTRTNSELLGLLAFRRTHCGPTSQASRYLLVNGADDSDSVSDGGNSPPLIDFSLVPLQTPTYCDGAPTIPNTILTRENDQEGCQTLYFGIRSDEMRKAAGLISCCFSWGYHYLSWSMINKLPLISITIQLNCFQIK